MALSHVTKWYGASDLEISKIIADWPAGTAPAAPAAPAIPVLSGAGAAGGAATWSYTVIATNGNDSVASTVATTAVGAASLSSAVPIIITPAVACPAGQVYIIQRTVTGNAIASPTGVIGRIGPGGTALTDSGQPGTPYVANASGTAYGPKVKLVGVKAFTLNDVVDNKELRGDFSLLDMNAVMHDLTFQSTFAKSNSDALGIMIGGSTVDTGATPNQVSTYSYSLTSRFSYFKIEAQTVSADPVNGDVHLVCYRGLLNAFPKLGTAEENYEVFDFTARLSPRLSDGKWIDAVINETATAIAN